MEEKFIQQRKPEKAEILISDEIWKIENRLMEEIFQRTETEWQRSFFPVEIDKQETQKTLLIR